MGPVDKSSARGRTFHCRPSESRAQSFAGATMLLLLLTASVVQTGPVIRSRRMIREIYVENSAATVPDNTAEVPAGASTNVTASDMCLHDGSYVDRAAMVCEKKHGCRAIQKTGECCPDYQCECQRDGKTYANGEKVFDPNTPCRSCYCQGGEIICSDVSCYKRNDCDPKYIPGRCCPEYDNCPPLENFKITESSTTNTKDTVNGSGERERADETNEVKGNYAAEAEDLLVGGLQKEPGSEQSVGVAAVTEATTTTTMTTTTTKASAMTNENPLGIKIKEITKPEEIRLTDNRPSAEEQQLQQQQQLAMAAAGRNTTPEPPTASQSEELVNLEHLDVNVPDDDGENGTKIVRHTDGDGVRSEEMDGGRKEPPASGESLKVPSAVENRLESGESSTAAGAIVSSSTLSESDEWLDVKEVAESSSGWSSSSLAPSFNPPSTTHVPPVPSTSGLPAQEHEESVSESNIKLSKQENALPAVVQIGDKLVIVDHNQPKPITVIQVEEVEGLQRGEDDTVYDQEAYPERTHHHASESGRESSKKLKLHNSAEQEQETLSTQADSSGSYETVHHPGSSEQLGVPVSSEEIFETQLYTEGPEEATPTEAERNGTPAQQREPLSVSREDFLHMDPGQEPAKLQQEEDHTTAASGFGGISSAYSSTEEGSTSVPDMSGAFSSEASGDEMIYDTHFYTEGPNTSSEEAKEQSATAAAATEETSTASGTVFVPRHPPAIADELTPQTYIEDNEPELILPGFQQIPGDVSLTHLNQPGMEMGDMMDHHVAPKQEKILSEVLELKANGSASPARPEESATTEGLGESSNSPAWLKEDPKPQLRTPGEPLLVPEWERNNGTNSSSSEEEQDLVSGSGSGAAPSAAEYNVLKMGSEEYVDAGGESGSGSGTLPTTSAPSSKAEAVRSDENGDDEDVDDGKTRSSELATASVSSSSGLDIDSPISADATDGQGSDTVNHNPKNDVESLKYDENENNATADEAIPKKVQQLESSERDTTGEGVQAPTLISI